MKDRSKINVYLAGPFFNPDQVDTQSKVEQIFDKYEVFSYFSPRLQQNGGFDKTAPEPERSQKAQEIFDNNEDQMKSTLLAVLNIDDRDTGTAWEFGYFYATKTPCITYSKSGSGANIMLAQSSLCHCCDLTALDELMKRIDDTLNITMRS